MPLAAVMLAAAAALPPATIHNVDLRRPAASGPLRLLTRIDAGEALEWAGWSLAGGDINGDGIGDLAIGAPGGTNDRPSRRGRVYVLLGRMNFPAVLDLRVRRSVTTVPNSSPVYTSDADIVIEGEDDFDHLGRGLAVADFDRDGFADLAIGAPGADGPGNGRSDCGEVVVLFGAAILPARVDLARPGSGPRMARVAGSASGESLGSVLSAGDVTGDGRADLLAGAPQARAAAEATAPLDTGAAMVIEPARIEAGILDLARPGAAGLTAWLHGPRPGDQAGSAIAAGDFDGDGTGDLAVGARGTDVPEGRRPDAGAVYLMLGPLAQGTRGNLEKLAVAIFEGERIGDSAGSSLRLGDLDGDGLEELLIGAEMSDGEKGSRLDAGGVSIVRGMTAPGIESLRALMVLPGNRPGRAAAPGGPEVPAGPVRADLARPEARALDPLHGGDPGDHLGIRAAVDLDGDGRADIVAGAEDASGRRNSRAGAGEVTLHLTGARPARAILWGPVGGTHLGRAVAAVDLNGDGDLELVIAAPQAGQSLAGRLYVVDGDWPALRGGPR